MKPTILFLINSIDIERGGLTRASLKQASFFAELGYETKMITFDFNPKYPLIRKKLLAMKRVHQDVQILNMFEELEGKKPHLTINTPIQKQSIEKLAKGYAYEKRPGHNAYRVYDNGKYLTYIAFRQSGCLHFIDYYNENRYRTKREEYDPWGNIKKIAYMDFERNRPRQNVYYNNEGQAIYTEWRNPKTDKLERTITFHKDGSISNYVNVNKQKIVWLKKVVDRLKNNRVIVVSDTRSTDEVLLDFNHEKVTKILRLHSTHLAPPYTLDSGIAPRLTNQFKQIDKYDAVVFLTEEQKMDVLDIVNKKKVNFHVIPHYHETNSAKKIRSFLPFLNKKKSRDEKLAVVVSRLSTLKRIDHIIKAFHIVVKEIPDAKLEIWGKGEQERALKKLISKLKLDSNVKLMGYTHQPDKIYQKGLFSVLASKSEGFALSVLESMYNETPVLSYHIKYGPGDMIVDNTNGYLVENNNIEALAKQMMIMFQNPKRTISMGKKASEYINQNFNKEIYKEKWMQTIDSALANKNSK